MSNKRLKPKKVSFVSLTKKYANDQEACIEFFKNAKWPTGYYCEKCQCTHYYFVKRHNVFECSHCGHQEYLLSKTLFQDNKLPLYKLILGLFLFFSENKGCTAIKLASDLDINYKSALRLCRKCRILMAQSNSEKILDSYFYESDVAYIGAKSKAENKQGLATEQQPFLAILSTDKENKYPNYLKLCVMSADNQHNIQNFVSKRIVVGRDRKLNTDGKTTYAPLAKNLTLQSEKILYEEKNHRLHWINVIIGNVKSNITAIYRGVSKRSLPLFLQEQEWRFNHRYTGKSLMDKIRQYIYFSSPMPESLIIYIQNISEVHFTSPVS